MYLKLFRLSLLLLLLVGSVLVFVSCKKDEEPIENTEPPIISTTASTTEAQTTTDAFSSASKDFDGSEVSAYIILDNEKTTINGTGVSFENNVLTVNTAGTYFFTGSLADGKIYVNITDEDEKVKLVLGGVNINCTSDAPIYIENSPKETVIILESDTANYLSDTSRQISDEATDYATAVIYSKDDLQLEGGGTLNITANFNKGIFSKNDIKIKNGSIDIKSTDDAIRGKDGIEIEGGTLNLVCGGDALRTSNETEQNKGDIVIKGGTINIKSSLDGIQAVGNLTIYDGTVNIESGGGATGNFSGGNDDFRGGMFSHALNKVAQESSLAEEGQSNTPSVKGIKSDKKLTISSGTFTVSSCDDTIHAPDVQIGGGSFSLKSDDDGIHGDESVSISGGEIDIIQSYEGIEGKVITVSGGNISLNSSDDGFNAASSDSADMGGMGNDASCIINITDGYVFINADGDGVDSNGSVNMSGGTVIVYGPENNGNGALDYGGSFTVSAGTLLATGSRGMAQSVTGSGVRVLNYNASFSQDTVAAIVSSSGKTVVGFKSPKTFESIIFASDLLDANETYSLYKDGSFKDVHSANQSVCFDGNYVPGTLVTSESENVNSYAGNKGGFMR
ncbi:MAG: carbohydrate-binding domain-containing protein [Acutalibacteraceae bacterium]